MRRELFVKIMENSFEMEAETFYESSKSEEDKAMQRMNKKIKLDRDFYESEVPS